MPRIDGILETALYVDDNQAVARWYREVFGFVQLWDDGRLIALAIAPRAVLLLFNKGASLDINPTPGGTIPPHDGCGQLHVAFAIPRDEIDAWRESLRARNIPIETEIAPPQGGHSLYFRDLSGNLVELAAPGLWPNDPD